PQFDTVKLKDNKIQVNARVLITSFDTAQYTIPPFKFAVGKDTFESNSLLFKVIQPFEVDTVSWEIRDIKPIYQPKTNWLLIIGVALAMLLVGVVAAWFIFKLNKKIKIKQEEKAVEAIITPQQAAEIALRELERIYQEKLWKSGKNKEYYTDLTGVLRQYIAQRYGIDAMEMTSDEILENLHHQVQIEQSAEKSLQQILRLADLVKFAKWKPASDEHDLSLKNAFAFVRETMLQIMQEETKTTDETDENS
ncbi:MAG: hypothetical protein LBR75_02180, partial [Prevotellaceae bacterium]|nr:hypothetical protein [Prevotellaceae bacterium]